MNGTAAHYCRMSWCMLENDSCDCTKLLTDGILCSHAGFFLALLLERCLFVDFPFYNQHFAHELDFNWAHHQECLLRFGHDPNATENQPERVPFGYETIAGEPSLPMRSVRLLTCYTQLTRTGVLVMGRLTISGC